MYGKIELTPEERQFASEHGLTQYGIALMRTGIRYGLTKEYYANVSNDFEAKQLTNAYVDYTEDWKRLTDIQANYITDFAKQHDNRFNVFQMQTIATAVRFNIDISSFTPEHSAESMTQYVLKEMLKRAKFETDRVFVDHVDESKLPIQGWKMHISCDSLSDYMRAIKILAPEFVRDNVSFKLLSPQYFLLEYSEVNVYGKEITVYLNDDFKYDNLSYEAQNFLFEEVFRKPDTDKNIGGRCNVRYGAFINLDHCIYDSYGNAILDQRTKEYYKPDFVDDIDFSHVENFYKGIYEKFQKTHDYNLYIQEYLTGREYTPGNSDYFMSVFKVNDKEVLDTILKQPSINVFHTAFNGMDFVSVHKDDDERLIDFCESKGIRDIIRMAGSSLKDSQYLDENYSDDER